MPNNALDTSSPRDRNKSLPRETERIAKSIAIETAVATLFPQTAEAAAKVDVILIGDENVDVKSAAKAARVSLDGNSLDAPSITKKREISELKTELYAVLTDLYLSRENKDYQAKRSELLDQRKKLKGVLSMPSGRLSR